ncbi:hypothetical protein [Intrasporangium calvum]|uniref:hypothetical protein n=1 Tax=Intrasporangium calvum TaxID=53358 RepID=UPI000DF6273F|nr:hypothetical protein [Intrasporangium calvum]AXG15094.1 hypothetical protein DN585_18235 [Intrasporangium calvum]
MIRRHPVKALFAVLVLLVAALGWSYATRDSVPVPRTADPEPGESLVVVGVGGISWDDVSPDRTPVLWGLLRDGAAASVSVKTLHLTTCPTDGWATLSAGEAAGPRAEGDRPECTPLPEVVGDEQRGYSVAGFAQIAAASREAAFEARLGLLGDSFADHTSCVGAIGPGAAIAAARSDGTVQRYTPFDEGTLVSELAQCPITLVDAGGILTTDPDPATHLEQTTAIEQRIARVRDAMPTGADLIVAGLADRDQQERLRILTATGPHYAPGILASASTRMEGIAQISDVTATILQRGGVRAVEPIGGRALSASPSPNNSESTAAQKLTRLTDIDTKADAMHRIVVPFLVVWLASALLALLVLWILWQRARPWHTRLSRQRILRLTRLVGLVAAGMPAATFLANLVPWWRWSPPSSVLVALLSALVLLISGLIAVVCLNGPWGSSALGPLAVLSAVTASVIGLDLMTGSRLQMSSIFGLQPLVGGRFYGMGNVAFALYGSAVILLCAAMAHALRRRNAPRLAVVVVLVLGGAALAVDVLPAWGADFGGPIALVPALGLLLMRVAGIRVSVRSLALVGLAAGLVVGLVCYLDWRRPEQYRSHPGRFFQTVLDGDAFTVVSRKLLANVELSTAYPALLAVVLAAAAFILVLVLQPGRFGTAPFARLVEEAPLLRDGLVAILVLSAIGFLTNDSGAAIPPVAMLLTVPLVVAAVAAFMAIERANEPVRRRRDRHHR